MIYRHHSSLSSPFKSIQMFSMCHCSPSYFAVFCPMWLYPTWMDLVEGQRGVTSTSSAIIMSYNVESLFYVSTVTILYGSHTHISKSCTIFTFCFMQTRVFPVFGTRDPSTFICHSPCVQFQAPIHYNIYVFKR